MRMNMLRSVKELIDLQLIYFPFKEKKGKLVQLCLLRELEDCIRSKESARKECLRKCWHSSKEDWAFDKERKSGV